METFFIILLLSVLYAPLNDTSVNDIPVNYTPVNHTPVNCTPGKTDKHKVSAGASGLFSGELLLGSVPFATSASPDFLIVFHGVDDVNTFIVRDPRNPRVIDPAPASSNPVFRLQF